MYTDGVFFLKMVIDTNRFIFTELVWLYAGPAAWHFVTLPSRESKIIRQVHISRHRSWGSLPVTVKIGKTEWQTSIFYDRKRNSYVLPIKALIRRKEQIGMGDLVTFSVQITG